MWGGGHFAVTHTNAKTQTHTHTHTHKHTQTQTRTQTQTHTDTDTDTDTETHKNTHIHTHIATLQLDTLPPYPSYLTTPTRLHLLLYLISHPPAALHCLHAATPPPPLPTYIHTHMRVPVISRISRSWGGKKTDFFLYIYTPKRTIISSYLYVHMWECLSFWRLIYCEWGKKKSLWGTN